MRGRTNASGFGGGELSINGDIISATVAENNILAGDFVEYKEVENVKDLFVGTAVDMGKSLPINENQYLTLINNSIRLIDLSGGTFNIISTLSNYVVSDFIMTDDNEFYACSNNPTCVFKFSIQSNVITVNLVGNYTGNATTLFVHEDKICALSNENIYIFNKSDLRYETEESLPQSLFYSNFANVYEDDNYAYISYKQTYYAFMYKFDKSTKKSTSLQIARDDVMNYIILHDKYILCSTRYDASSAYDQVYLHVINMELFSRQEYNLSQYGLFGLSGYGENGSTVVGKIYNTNKFLILCTTTSLQSSYSQYYTLSTFEMDDAYNIKRIGNVVKVDLEKGSRAKEIYANGDKIFPVISLNTDGAFYNDTYAYGYNHSPTYDSITPSVDENYVTPYHGGSAIGVAKETGAIGKEIDIYIPKVIQP